MGSGRRAGSGGWLARLPAPTPRTGRGGSRASPSANQTRASPASSSACSSSGSAARASRSSSSTEGRLRTAMRAHGGDDEGERLPGLVAGRASSLGRLLGDRRLAARRRLRVREIELEVDIEPQRPGQLERPLEQRSGRSIVAAPERAAAGGGKTLAGPLGESWIGLSELGLVARRLLEVVADDLVQLDQVFAALLRARRRSARAALLASLSERVVGRVADQEVAEAEGVVSPGICAVSGRMRSLRTSEARRGVTCDSSGERLDGAAVEDLALDRTSLEHGALGALELVEPRGEERLQRRRDDDLALASPRPSPPSRSTKRGFPPAARAIRSRRSSVSLPGSARRPPFRQRLEPERDRPLRGGARPDSGRARQRSSIGAPRGEQGDVLDQVEEGLLAPLDVVEEADERLPAPRAACGTPRRSPLPRSARPSRRGASGSRPRRRDRRQRVQLLDHLDHRPVGDPLAVGEAAAADDSGRRADARNSAGEPRLADAGIADHGHELARVARRRRAARPRAERRSSPTPADERRLVPALGRLVRPRPAGRRAPALPFPSARAARALRPRPRRGRARRSPRRSGCRPGSPPAPGAPPR